MKKTTEILSGHYLIWPVWENEVYNEEFAKSGSPICIEIDSSRSTDILSDLEPRNKVILMCFRLSVGLKTAQKRSNFQSSLISERERERECSEFRRTLIIAVVLLYPSPCKAFYNTDSLCRFKLFCLLFRSQNLNFKCFPELSTMQMFGCREMG